MTIILIGSTFWGTKRKEFRAFDVEVFAEWKPTTWRMFAQDYGVDLEPLEIFSSDSETQELQTQERRMPSTSSIDELTSVVDDLKKLRDEIMKKQSFEEVKTTLKCTLCCDLNLFFYFCPKCGCRAGCFECCYRLNLCPLCRGQFAPKGERVPQFIPGLAGSLGVSDVSLSSLRARLAQQSQDSASDESNDD